MSTMLEEMAKSGWVIEIHKSNYWHCYRGHILGVGNTLSEAVRLCYDAWKESEK
jgi:hypothetical protein